MQASYDFCKPENKALADAASRSFDSKGSKLTQHWVDFEGRVLQGATKAQQRQLIGAAEYAEQPLTVQTARSLLAPMIDVLWSRSCTYSHARTHSLSISISVKPVPTFNWRAP